MAVPRIGRRHALCAIGSGAEQVWASARAGIARIGNSHVMDRHFDAIRMGLVPEEALPPLEESLDTLPLPPRARRMLRLAAPSLKAVCADHETPVPLVLALPPIAPEAAGWVRHVPAYLQNMTGATIDRQRSVVLPLGRAAGLLALERALQMLATGDADTVIVGGVDTFLDLRLLSELDAEQRILGPRVMDGFIPGEGAAFYELTTAPDPHGAAGRVMVHGAASAMDPGHRYGDAPAKGEGLSLALAQLRERMAPLPGPIATTFAGFNGESFDAKMWGVAYLRHRDLFAPSMVIEHPADKFGDAGAAMGAILVAMAAESLSTGARSGPALVWAASDREPRGCAILSRQ